MFRSGRLLEDGGAISNRFRFARIRYAATVVHRRAIEAGTAGALPQMVRSLAEPREDKKP